MACLESAIFSIDLDDEHIDDIMYQEGGSGFQRKKTRQQETRNKHAIQKGIQNTTNKIKKFLKENDNKQLSEEETKTLKRHTESLLRDWGKNPKKNKTITNALNLLSSQSAPAPSAASASGPAAAEQELWSNLLKISVNSVYKLKKQMDKAKAQEDQEAKVQEEKEEKKKEMLLSNVFKISVKMKQERDMKLLESLAEQMAKKFIIYLSQNDQSESVVSDDEYAAEDQYKTKCLQKFKNQHNRKKIKYDLLYDYLNDPKKITDLLNKL